LTHYDQLYDITLHKPVILTYILLRPVNVTTLTALILMLLYL